MFHVIYKNIDNSKHFTISFPQKYCNTISFSVLLFFFLSLVEIVISVNEFNPKWKIVQEISAHPVVSRHLM